MPNQAQFSASFARPSTPAAKCMHHIRLGQQLIRNELVEATALSQPTVTRAVTALMQAGLVRERPDLTQSTGPGRPNIPLELAPSPWIHAGVAIGTRSSYIALFDTRGRTLRDSILEKSAIELDPDTFLEHLIAGVNRLTTGIDLPLVGIGVATSGKVTTSGVVTANNLGWNAVDIAGRMNYQFSVPATIASAIPAIAASELQAAPLPRPDKNTPVTLTFYADDSVGAAYSDSTGVHVVGPLQAAGNSALDTHGMSPEDALNTQGFLNRVSDQGIYADTLTDLVAQADKNNKARTLLDERAALLAHAAAAAAHDLNPSTLVLSGSAFSEDQKGRSVFAAELKKEYNRDIELRLIPTHRENVRAAARAVALDRLLNTPLALVPEEAAS
ncbi:MarR family protein [Corynebacterium faecale]|uniref:ROK family protein n=1 Tax=Corynebacterium faecale TaxID=1758466 RepID=UPI0025B5163F|nr:ROK family protein [Corynebacterium faecale]WJY90980.1 MarR family protein [Corynebacterium faecale]